MKKNALGIPIPEHKHDWIGTVYEHRQDGSILLLEATCMDCGKKGYAPHHLKEAAK